MNSPQLQEPILLRTKINPPISQRNQVDRLRLVALIEQGMHGRLTLVTAPAGFGKTTLLSQWVEQTDNTIAWISLDGMDNDAIRFWRYVCHSLLSTLPRLIGAKIRQLVHTLSSLSVYTFLDALINELYTVDRPVALLLDDYHLIEEQGIHDALAYFIEHLPQQIHVLISSRNELPFPTVKWSVRDELTLIDTQQLKFTYEESEAFYQEGAGIALTPQQIAHLYHRTEGWATGLQLASISLRSETNYEQFIASFTGYSRNVADYLFQEVAAKLPEDLQAFLLRTAVLERMDADTCNDLTHRSDGEQILERLKAWNLFILPLDDHGIWYRYHHLFAEFLRNLAKRKHPEIWLQANGLASKSFASRGYMDEAIDHALAADDYAAAEGLLSDHIANMLQRGEFPTLLRWFNSFPTMSLSPDLLLIHAFILVVAGQTEQAEQQLHLIEQQFVSKTSGEAYQQLQSGLLFVRSNLVFANGQFEQWFAFATGILDVLLPHSPIFYNFNYNQSDSLVRRNAFGMKGVLSKDTEKIGKLFSSVLEKHGWEESLINLYLLQSLAEGYYEWNRLEDSQQLLHKIERAAAVLQKIPGLYVPHRITQANIYWASGKPELAQVVIEEAIAVVLKQTETHWAAYLQACQIKLWLLEGRLADAKKAVKTLRIHSKNRPTFNREYEYMALCRLLAVQHKEPEALRLLDLLKPQAQRERSLISLVEISIAQACLKEQLGHRIQAFSALHEALVIGEANGYVRSFIDAGDVLARLLERYSKQGAGAEAGKDQISRAYLQRLLEACPNKVMQETSGAAASLIEPLTRSELHLLQLIHLGDSNKQIADKLSLSLGTVKVYVSRLYGKLGVSSRIQALIRARELQLLESKD